MKRFIFPLLLGLFFQTAFVYAQISSGGVPKSFSTNELQGFQLVELTADLSKIQTVNEKQSTGDAIPYEIGFSIPVNFTTKNSGTWFTLKDGTKVWKLRVKSKGAEALSVDFENFHLPDGAELFIYNAAESHVIGAFTSENNKSHGYFATEMIQGDEIVLEYILPANASSEEVSFTVTDIAYIYRDSGFNTFKSFGSSGSCEININCVEGTNWQSQKKGIARIYGKDGGTRFWCTGSLINNTRQDFTPYFFTANHCGDEASISDYLQWVFYFNYEAEGCSNPSTEPDNTQTMTGSSLIANADQGISSGSDFKLLLLDDDVPNSYEPYYNGWNRSTNPAQSGVTIHHPQGDIKKISTYTQTLVSSSYDGDAENLNGLYWRVNWAETTTGWGVTEGGSSGSPLFDQNGYIVGSLTGGRASCSALYAPDYYGKFYYSWSSNGISDNRKLQPWLDPINSGAETLSGISFDDIPFIAQFESDSIVPIGSSVYFTDLSAGAPTQWSWTFEGGQPSTSSLQTPPAIVYPQYGKYDVTLVISSPNKSATIVRQDYIKVVPIVGPTPSANGIIEVHLGTVAVSGVIFTIYDESGRQVLKEIMGEAIKMHTFDLSKCSAGYYFLRIETPNSVDMYKMVIL